MGSMIYAWEQVEKFRSIYAHLVQSDDNLSKVGHRRNDRMPSQIFFSMERDEMDASGSTSPDRYHAAAAAGGIECGYVDG